ncbi:MAG: transketolase family protein [Oscillospiraceae bacterium]|nr:transketolase family protein [Oscillospiraceae bacterium]
MKLSKKYELGKKIATREAYGDALAEFGADPRIIVLDADLSKSTKTANFKKVYPERFVNCGIAEGNMMAVAAGMATTGKIPFASSFAMFAAGRAFEQVRNAIGYPHLNVKIGATHAGITVGEDGATHQCNEDIGVMRTIPGMVILNPADAAEARACVKAAIDYYGPVYMRYGRLSVPVIFDEDTFDFEIGKGQTIVNGTDVTIAATGIMTASAIEAAKALSAEGISARVVNICTIKPIDKELLIKCAAETGAVVTAEEHNIIGGLGSAVCETVCEAKPVPVIRVGIKDVFGKSGKATELIDEFGLSAKDLVAAAKAAIALKLK